MRRQTGTGTKADWDRHQNLPEMMYLPIGRDAKGGRSKTRPPGLRGNRAVARHLNLVRRLGHDLPSRWPRQARTGNGEGGQTGADRDRHRNVRVPDLGLANSGCPGLPPDCPGLPSSGRPDPPSWWPRQRSRQRGRPGQAPKLIRALKNYTPIDVVALYDNKTYSYVVL